jgi:hypothetical protein
MIKKNEIRGAHTHITGFLRAKTYELREVKQWQLYLEGHSIYLFKKQSGNVVSGAHIARPYAGPREIVFIQCRVTCANESNDSNCSRTYYVEPKRSQGPSPSDSLTEPTHQLLLCFFVCWSDAMKSQPREIRKTFFRKQVDETALS